MSQRRQATPISEDQELDPRTLGLAGHGSRQSARHGRSRRAPANMWRTSEILAKVCRCDKTHSHARCGLRLSHLSQPGDLSLSLHLHSPHIVAPSTNSRRGYKPSLRVYPLDTPRSSVRQQRQPERATWSKRSPIAIPNSSPLPLPLKIGTEHATSKQLPLYGGESL